MGNIQKFNDHKKTPDKLQLWEIQSKIEKIVNSNIKEIPYEGTEVDTLGLRESILDLIYELCPEYRPDGWGNTSIYAPW